MPRVEEDQLEQKEEEEEKTSHKYGKIVAADDQNINIEVLKTDFAELNLTDKVEFASNGQEVIDLVKEIFVACASKITSTTQVLKPIDLLLIDFQMPFKTGFQVIEEIKQYYKTQSQGYSVEEPIFVLMSAYATPAFRKHALANGVTHVYEKPLDIEQLKALVDLSANGVP